MEDRQLVNAVLAGDEAAGDFLVERFQRFVYSILLRNMRLSRPDADDVFIEVFTRLFDDGKRRLRAWRGDDNLHDYIATLTRHTAIDLMRGRTRRRETEFLDPDNPPSGSAEGDPLAQLLDSERGDALRKAVARLSAADRDLFRRRFVFGQSPGDIANDQGRARNAVDQALFQLRRRLLALAGGTAARPGQDVLRSE